MSGVPLLRGEGDRDQTTAQEMLTAVVLCGILIVVAAPAVKWITSFDTKDIHLESDDPGETTTFWISNDDRDELYKGMTKQEAEKYAIPPGVTSIFSKLIMGIKAIAAFVMIIALVWGGIKLKVREPLKASTSAKRQTRKSVPQPGE